MLLSDNKRMQQRLKAMQETINSLTEKNAVLLAEKAVANWNFNGNVEKDNALYIFIYRKINL